MFINITNHDISRVNNVSNMQYQQYQPSTNYNSKVGNVTSANLTLISIEATELTSIWNKLFNCIFSHKILPIQNNTFTIQTQSCIKSLNINITSLMLQTHDILSPNPLIFSFHHMLKLRRQIMIIFKQLLLKSDRYNIYDNLQIVYFKLMDIFVLIYKNHNEYTIYNENFKLYHIHVSKAAGRTVLSRIRSLSNMFTNHKLDDENTNFGKESHNFMCKSQYNENKGSHFLIREDPMMTYTDEHTIIDRKFLSSKRNGIPTKRRRLGDNVHNERKPALCRKFIYILPFREPLERLFSQSSQFNYLAPFAGKNILRKTSSIKNIEKTVDIDSLEDDKHKMNFIFQSYNKYCNMKSNILINGEKYQVLSRGAYFRGFYKFLYDTELQYLASMNRNDKDMRPNIMQKYPKTHHLWQFKVPRCSRSYGEEEHFQVFAINQTVHDLNESEFIWVVHETKLRESITWLRTKMLSNTYTTWLGYYQNATNLRYASSTTPNYVYRKFIAETHLENAINFILKVDYVMPFTTKKYQENVNKDHKIWNITLYNVFKYVSKRPYFEAMNQYNSDYNHDGIRKKDYYHKYGLNNLFKVENDFLSYVYPYNEKHYKYVQWTHQGQSSTSLKLFPGLIENALSQDENDLLIQLNQLDITLYSIAKLIENVDVDFYQTFVKEDL